MYRGATCNSALLKNRLFTLSVSVVSSKSYSNEWTNGTTNVTTELLNWQKYKSIHLYNK